MVALDYFEHFDSEVADSFEGKRLFCFEEKIFNGWSKLLHDDDVNTDLFFFAGPE